MRTSQHHTHKKFLTGALKSPKSKQIKKNLEGFDKILFFGLSTLLKFAFYEKRQLVFKKLNLRTTSEFCFSISKLIYSKPLFFPHSSC